MFSYMIPKLIQRVLFRTTKYSRWGFHEKYKKNIFLVRQWHFRVPLLSVSVNWMIASFENYLEGEC